MLLTRARGQSCTRTVGRMGSGGGANTVLGRRDCGDYIEYGIRIRVTWTGAGQAGAANGGGTDNETYILEKRN